MESAGMVHTNGINIIDPCLLYSDAGVCFIPAADTDDHEKNRLAETAVCMFCICSGSYFRLFYFRICLRDASVRQLWGTVHEPECLFQPGRQFIDPVITSDTSAAV